VSARVRLSDHSPSALVPYSHHLQRICAPRVRVDCTAHISVICPKPNSIQTDSRSYARDISIQHVTPSSDLKIKIIIGGLFPIETYLGGHQGLEIAVRQRINPIV